MPIQIKPSGRSLATLAALLMAFALGPVGTPLPRAGAGPSPYGSDKPNPPPAASTKAMKDCVRAQYGLLAARRAELLAKHGGKKTTAWSAEYADLKRTLMSPSALLMAGCTP